MHPPISPQVATPAPLAKLKEQSLLQELRRYSAEPVAAESAAAVATTAARLWFIAASAAVATTITLARANPKHMIPIGYAGASVAIALTTGTAIQSAKSRAHQNIAAALLSARPLSTLCNRWGSTEARQLKRFDELVAEHLFNQWVVEQPQTITITTEALPEAPAICPAQDLGHNPQSALIGGVPGAGKGVFYLLALHHLKQQHPDIRVMLINPKASAKESGTGKAPALVLSRDFETTPPDESALWLWDCIEQFQRWEGPKLLIIDEMASIMATLKLSKSTLQIRPRFAAFLQHLTSMGDSEQKYLWLISQDCSSDGLGISSAIRATLRAIAIIAPHNKQALSAFLSGQWLPSPDGGRAELAAIMQSSEVGRAIFDGKDGQWRPMPKMQNLTGWDRDQGQSTEQPKAEFWDEPAELDYFDVWQEWLQNRPKGTCTTRQAQQSAPRQVRTTAAGTREAFRQLQRMKFGTFDCASDCFTLLQA